MAERRSRLIPAAVLTIDPFLHYELKCRWTEAIGGTRPAGLTIIDHLSRAVQEEVEQAIRAMRGQRPSQIAAQVMAIRDTQNGEEEEGEDEVISKAAGLKEQMLKQALQHPNLDPDLRYVLEEAFRELLPGEKISRALQRATNTFPRNEAGNLVVPNVWFMGGMKAALQRDNNMYANQAQNIAKGCIIIRTPWVDLGTTEPDEIENPNIPLPSARIGEAQATTKLFKIVDPRKHGKELFTLEIMVNDSPYVLRMFNLPNPKEDAHTQPVAEQLRLVVQRLFTVVGICGVGANRPNRGTFEVLACTQIKKGESK